MSRTGPVTRIKPERLLAWQSGKVLWDDLAERAYRRVLTEAGWQERPRGNSPDQIAGFSAARGAEQVDLVLFGPGTVPNYRLLALG